MFPDWLIIAIGVFVVTAQILIGIAWQNEEMQTAIGRFILARVKHGNRNRA